MTIVALELAGRCRSGWDSGGSRAHACAVAEGRVNDGYVYFGGKALCGAEPGRHSMGWSEKIRPAVTCPKCLKKLASRAKDGGPGFRVAVEIKG